MKDPVEITLGIGSIASYFLLAQAGDASNLVDYIQPVVSTGLAVWLAVHHTRITIPNMQAAHTTERQKDREAFQKQLSDMQVDHKTQLADERRDHAAEMERQRAQFAELMNRNQCKWKA